MARRPAVKTGPATRRGALEWPVASLAKVIRHAILRVQFEIPVRLQLLEEVTTLYVEKKPGRWGLVELLGVSPRCSEPVKQVICDAVPNSSVFVPLHSRLVQLSQPYFKLFLARASEAPRLLF